MTSEGAPDDAAVVAALRAGDEAAFERLVRLHHRGLVAVARTFVPTDAVAQEVAQDTWLAVVGGIDGFEGRSSLRTWLFRILANKARDRGERERRSLPLSAIRGGDERDDEPAVDPSRFVARDAGPWPGHWVEPPADWGTDAERRLLGRELQGVIRAALEALPPAQRLVMTMRDVTGLDADEVCAVLDLTPGNQRVLLHRARSRVRAAVERYLEESGSV